MAAIFEVKAVDPVEVIDSVLTLDTVVILIELIDSVRLSGVMNTLSGNIFICTLSLSCYCLQYSSSHVLL